MRSATPNLAIAASVSPPPAIEKAFEAAIASASASRAVGERVELEHADRAVPDDGAGALRAARASAVAVCGPMSRIMSSSCTSCARLDRRCVSRARTPSPHHHVHGQRHLRAARLHHHHDLLRLGDQVGLGERLADRQARGEQEGVGDAAADDQLVDLLRERLEDGELGRDLGAGDDRDQRPLRVRERACPARRARRPAAGPAHGDRARSARRRAWSPRRGARCRRRRSRRRRRARRIFCASASSSFFSPLLKRQFSSSTTSPRLHLDAVDPVAHQRHVAAEQLGQALGDRRERVLGLRELALLRPAEVRGDHHRRALLERRAGCRRREARMRVSSVIAPARPAAR